jgi:histidyl-tRNA synthetase
VAEKFQAPKGTYDVLPSPSQQAAAAEPWTVSSHWIWIEQQLRVEALAFGFQEIRTPIFESTAVFARTAGDTSDVVSKEMYTFEDRAGRELSLRPEGTAPAARALIEAGMLQPGVQQRIFYIEPMFRYERPQAGRFRQHTQFGVEWFGCDSPDAEVECIHLMWRIYQRLGLRRLKIMLNTLGTREDRQRYREQLIAYLLPQAALLSEESQARLEKNPLRILDSKSPADQKILAQAPRLWDALSQESRLRFERVQALLASLDIPFEIAPQLVRGFDYYTHTVWEVVAEGIGAQASVGGGGRYDHLVHELGGPVCPGIGFGMGLERLLAVLAAEGLCIGPRLSPQVYVVPMGSDQVAQAMRLAGRIRDLGVRTELVLDQRRLKATFARASDQKVLWVALLGPDEVSQGLVSLKNLESGVQQQISVDEALVKVSECAIRKESL